MLWGNNDEVSQPWAMEHSYHSALRAYELLGKPEALSVLHLPGTHGANDQNRCLDWLDIQFGRSDKKWTNDLTFTYNYTQWLKASGETVDLAKYTPHKITDTLLAANGSAIASTAGWERKAADIRNSVNWMLGEKNPHPPAVTLAPSTFDPVNFAIRQHASSCGWLQPQAGQTTSRRITFGDNLKGDLYYPTNTPAGTRLPAVIWLHGYSYSLGYMWVYHSDLHPILALVREGYAVLAFDQSGFGTRMNESAVRYQFHPHWSQLGKMIEDTRAGIDALQKDALVDPEKIFLYGYSMGGSLALHTAALEPRVKGVVSICGFTPMRTDTLGAGAGGLQRYCQDRELLPRTGFFIGQEAKVPYDYDELIAAIAPRPVYIVSPRFDRDATPADVRAAVESSRNVFGLYHAADKLKLEEPWDYNRLPNATQDRALAWMKQHLK